MEKMTYFNLLHQEYGHEGHKSDTDDYSDDSFSKCELRLKKILVPIMVLLLVGLQDVFV